MSFAHILRNVQTGTKPPKHMRARDSRGRSMTNAELAAMPKNLDLDRLLERCEARGSDPADVIALALTPEARENAEETGMTLRVQAELSVKLVDKFNPSQQAIKHSGDQKEPVRLIIEG